MEYTKEQIEEFKRKADSYDQLYSEIAECYEGYEDEEGEWVEEEDYDLNYIGELAASHFGFL